MSQDIGTQIQDGGVPKPSHLERVWNLFFGTTLPWAPKMPGVFSFPDSVPRLHSLRPCSMT